MTIATVLLVEDNSDLRELLRTALVAWEYNVLAAEDGRRGLAFINNEAEKIDMLLVDITLPFLSGMKLCKALNSQRPTTKCLMMSGYDEPPSGVGERSSNCRFIQKPFRLHELRTAIGDMLAEGETKM